MVEFSVAVEGPSGPALARELAQRAKKIPGASGRLPEPESKDGAKGGLAAAALAILSVVGEQAIEPLLETLKAFLTRDSRSTLNLKFADGTEFQLNSVRIDQLEAVGQFLERMCKSHAK